MEYYKIRRMAYVVDKGLNRVKKNDRSAARMYLYYT